MIRFSNGNISGPSQDGRIQMDRQSDEIWRRIAMLSGLNIFYHLICLLKYFTHPKGFIVIAQISSASHAVLNGYWYMRID